MTGTKYRESAQAYHVDRGLGATVTLKNGVTLQGRLVEGGHASLLFVRKFWPAAGGVLQPKGCEIVLGVAHQKETIRIGLFRRKIATLRYDPTNRELSVEE